MSGNHEEIRRWRNKEALEKTLHPQPARFAGRSGAHPAQYSMRKRVQIRRETVAAV